MKSKSTRGAALGAAVLGVSLVLHSSPPARGANSGHGNGASSVTAPTCQLNGGISAIVYIQFDTVHFRRDDPNVPSDLEQMPNLLNFMQQQGTLLTNHHTPLISHTSVDILTALSGL